MSNGRFLFDLLPLHRSCIVCPPKASLLDVCRFLSSAKVHRLWITDDRLKVTAVCTMTDIMWRLKRAANSDKFPGPPSDPANLPTTVRGHIPTVVVVALTLLIFPVSRWQVLYRFLAARKLVDLAPKLNVQSLSHTATVTEAINTLAKHNLSALPLVYVDRVQRGHCQSSIVSHLPLTARRWTASMWLAWLI